MISSENSGEIDKESEVMKELPLLADGVVVVSLHVGPVPEPGLHDGVLQHTDPDVHPQQLLLHPGQVLPDVDQRGAVSHGTPLLLHLALDGLDIVRDLSEDSGSLSDAATDLFVLLPVLSVGLRELSEVGKC